MSEEKQLPGKFNRSAISVEEAQQLILPYVQAGGSETVPLLEAKGRVLAVNIVAPHPFPHFRRSSMDGFAIRSADTYGASPEQPVMLEVIDEIPAGSLPSSMIEEGMAARLMTGAKVPDQADAVVMLEHTEIRESGNKTFIFLNQEVESGAYIVPIGFELEQDSLLLQAGTEIGAGEITVLATFGIHQAQVKRKPKVAICATGSELLNIEEPLADGKIRNSNTYTLACQIEEAGGEPYILDAIIDDLHIAKNRVEEALAAYDMLITTGGVSIGDFDIMADLVQDGSLKLLFNKVAMRPGSVTTAAVSGDKLLFALSGNPGACFVGFEMFVRPAIRTVLGAEDLFLRQVEAVLAADYGRMNTFTRYVRSRLYLKDGLLHVLPAQLDESGVMITIKDSDGIMVVPPREQGLKAGERVQVILLP